MDVGTIDLERHRGVWLLTLRGEHDVSNADALRDALDRSFSDGSTVIVDLSQASFIDSTVLGALLDAKDVAAAHEEHSLAMVAPAGGFTRRVLDLVDVSTQIRTFESRAAAIGALAPSEERLPD